MKERFIALMIAKWITFHIKYKPDPEIIVYLLESVYGTEIIQLFQQKLVSNLNHHEYEWSRENIQGMKVSVDFLCEFGQLILNKGVIYGKRLLFVLADLVVKCWRFIRQRKW